MPDATPLSIQEPTGTPRGGIVVVQEAFGVNDHIEDITRRFAAEGYLAVAPHLFHRTGDPKLGYTDIKDVIPHMMELTAEGVMSDIDAALGHLEANGITAEHTGVTGFCMGGTVTLLVSASRPLGAGVTFYGGGVVEGRFGFRPLVDVAPELQTPWLGLFGDLDAGIPPTQVEQLRAAAAQSDQPTEVVRYPDAEHGFHCDQRDSYHEASAKDAWARTLEWFDRYL